MSELFAWVFFRLFLFAMTYVRLVCQSICRTHTYIYIIYVYIYMKGCRSGFISQNATRTSISIQYQRICPSVHTSIHHVDFIFCQHNFHDIDLYIHRFMSQNKCLSKRGGKCPWWLVLQVLSELKVVCGISGRPWAKGKTNPNTGVFAVRMGALRVNLANTVSH